MSRKPIPQTPDAGSAPGFVQTRFSGVLVSLPSDGAVDVKGDIRYSAALIVALMRWLNQRGRRDVSVAEHPSAVSSLADEIQRRFGVTRTSAEDFARDHIGVVNE